MEPSGTNEINLRPSAQERQPSDFAGGLDDAAEPGFFEQLLHSPVGKEKQNDSPQNSELPLRAQEPILAILPEEMKLSRSASQTLVRVLWDAVRRKQQEVELKLRPSTHGKLVLRIQVQGNQVHLQALAEDPRILSLLLASKGELASGLARWGLVLGRFEAHSPNPIETDLSAGSSTVNHLSLEAAAELRRSFIKVVA